MSKSNSGNITPLRVSIDDEMQEVQEIEVIDISKPKKSIWDFLTWKNIIIICLVMAVISVSITALQYKKYGEIIAEEAYVVSVSINLMEENMLLKYEIFPQEIESLAELRTAWIDNPCHETAMNYYNALNEALDSIETSIEKLNA